MSGKNRERAADQLDLWTAWELFTAALLHQERLGCHPFATARLDEANAYMADLLWTVRKAREEALAMKADFPGAPSPCPVTREGS